MLLEAKLELLQKKLDEKEGESLNMSKVINEVQAQKEFFMKKTANLEQKLELEHQEKETLHQSIVHFQHSHRLDPIKNGHVVDGPLVVDTEIRPINPHELPPEGQRWQTELEVLEQMGYMDRARNIELMVKYQDVTRVVNDYKRSDNQNHPTNIPEPTRVELPEDIQQVDITMLEAMGFFDLKKNIELLRKCKDVSVVVETLLSG